MKGSVKITLETIHTDHILQDRSKVDLNNN